MSCVVRYDGADYDVDDTGGVIWTLIRDRLNAAADRRDIPAAREYFGAADPAMQAVEGDLNVHVYNPFVALPLVGGGVVVIHVHDGMTLTIVERTGDLTPTDLFDEVRRS